MSATDPLTHEEGRIELREGEGERGT